MEDRYKKIVFEAEEGVCFKVTKKNSGEVNIRAYNISKEPTIYSRNYIYENPPVPEGYRNIEGQWYNGFVIERCSDLSQFVWIPVESLDYDGTLDGKSFVEKFGRRNYLKEDFSIDGYDEPLEGELIEQFESVKSYGGFYISCYHISMDLEKNVPKSVKDAIPLVNIGFKQANLIASAMEVSENVKSHLTYGAEYDSVISWLIKSKAKTIEDIMGARLNTEKKNMLRKTGRAKSYNKFYDLEGNIKEWTQEMCGMNRKVVRGYNLNYYGKAYVCDRCTTFEDNTFKDVGFRVCLYIKPQ